MTDKEKAEWAKRAFEEIAKDCEEIASLEIVSEMEESLATAIAVKARRNIRILEEK